MKIKIRPDLKRKEFSERLTQAIDRLGVPERGRTTWLKNQWLLHTDEDLSIAAFRKWLTGGAIPDPSRLDALAVITQASVQQLLGLSEENDSIAPDRSAATALAIRSSTLDAHVLADVLVAVEGVLAGSSVTITAEQKARLIQALYIQRHLSGDQGCLEALARVTLTYIMCEQYSHDP